MVTRTNKTRTTQDALLTNDYEQLNRILIGEYSREILRDYSFDETTIKFLESEYADEAIIASLRATHERDKTEVSIFISREKLKYFCAVFQIKHKEVGMLLLGIAYRGDNETLITYSPTLASTSKNLRRLRQEFSDYTSKVYSEHTRKKVKEYPMVGHKELTPEEAINVVQRKGKRLAYSEMKSSKEAWDLAVKEGYEGLERLVFVAEKALIDINQIKMIADI